MFLRAGTRLLREEKRGLEAVPRRLPGRPLRWRHGLGQGLGACIVGQGMHRVRRQLPCKTAGATQKEGLVMLEVSALGSKQPCSYGGRGHLQRDK